MTNNTSKNGLTTKQTLAGLGVIFLLALFTYIGVSMGTAKADTQSLQEIVQMKQKAYDKYQQEARAAMQTYCESWKELGLAKRQLLKTLQITDPNINRGYDNCRENVSWYVPSSF